MILCCCNGLYLLWSYTGAGHLVWNPSTNESVELPDHEYPAATRSTYGLAFDSINDDYKILKIDNKGSSTSLNKIFALKSGCWRCIDNHPRSFVNSVWGEDSLAFVRGAFHWIYGEVLLYFSMYQNLGLNQGFRTSDRPYEWLLEHSKNVNAPVSATVMMVAVDGGGGGCDVTLLDVSSLRC
ncbi:putative beta-glucosidase 18-like [Capsicum annuum]|nr:putative beta-glucosidase 18-like [Capsicum annuum]